MAGPANEVERPIQGNTSSASVRRRAPAVAAALLILANALGITAFLNRPEPEVRSAIDTTATPSWRVETGWEKPDGKESRAGVAEVAGVEVSAPLDPAEVVTPEQIRAANTPPCSPDPSSWVDVRQMGAKGNGRADDTAAIQKANDAVAKRGGGRVIFSPGLYKAIGVQQDSCVEFAASSGARLIHPDGTNPTAIVESRVESSTGSIAANSRVLKVVRANGMRPGVIVAIQGAGGRSGVQRTELASGLGPYEATVLLKNTTGLQRHWTNHLYIANEIISYDGISGNTLLNVKRGLYGTKSSNHHAGSLVAQALRLQATVVRVTGKRVTLDRVSKFRVENADVKVGAIGMSITSLALDGNRPRGGSGETNMVSVRYQLARFATIRGSTLQDGYHGGVIFEWGTSDSVIDGNTFVDNGDPWDYGGSAIWLSQGAQRNRVRGNVISGKTFTGITIDDRTVYSSEYDGDGTSNLIENNTIDIPMFSGARNAGVVMFGARDNEVIHNNISNARTGVLVARSVQGPIASVARYNTVRDNVFFGHRVGINVSGSDNSFVRNQIRDARRPWTNSGRRNLFVDNTVE